MKTFKTFIKEATADDLQTDRDAEAFHSAVHYHLSNINNFKKILKNRGSDGLHSVSVNDLKISKELKQKYNNLHTIKLGNIKRDETLKGDVHGTVDYSRGPKRKLFGLSILPGKKGNHLEITNMTHMNPGLINNPDMHKFVQKHTLDSWDKSLLTFRHEFEHVKQIKRNDNIKVGTNLKDYHNSDHEMGANLSTLRYHFKAALQSHPEHFEHINPAMSILKPKHITNEVLKGISKTGEKTNNTAMHRMHSWYKGLKPENREKVRTEVKDMVMSKFDVMHIANHHYKEKIEANKPKFKSNYGADIYSRSYTPYGVEGHKPKVASKGYTPEGIMFEPHESMRQVAHYHNHAFAPVKHEVDEDGEHFTHIDSKQQNKSKLNDFYAKHKLIVPPIHSYGKIKKGESKSDHVYYENNPHIVSKYLNTMSKHFPEIKDHFGHTPINHDVNNQMYDDDHNAIKLSKLGKK